MQKPSSTGRTLFALTATIAVAGAAFAQVQDYTKATGKDPYTFVNKYEGAITGSPFPSTVTFRDITGVVVTRAPSLVGQPAPAFSLPDQNDKTHNLADSKGKWTVLAFYPKDETSGCTLQNKSYSAAKAKFGTENAVFYTVSTQDSASKKAFCTKDALTHTLLADVGGSVAKQYGVYMPDNGLAKRVTFYIAPDGTIAEVDQQIKVATAAEDSLAKLAALKASYKPAAGVSASAPKAVAGPPKLGQPVPTFTLSNPATGSTQSLKELSAGKKATVLIFVATQCPVSNAYNARMANLAAAYGDKGVQFVGINSNKQESATEVVSHAKQNGLTFPILKDPDNKIADQYDAKVTPEVFVLDAKGNLAFHGPIDDKQDVPDVKQTYLKDALDSLTQGRSVVVKGARAFGCTIKRVSKS